MAKYGDKQIKNLVIKYKYVEYKYIHYRQFNGCSWSDAFYFDKDFAKIYNVYLEKKLLNKHYYNLKRCLAFPDVGNFKINGTWQDAFRLSIEWF